jgi:D-alanyl-D-alanine carboxypeptidase (penicillin-binding protein 5/6)
MNTNRLINSSSASYRPGAYGVKTGTTDRAGQCLVAASEEPDATGTTTRGLITVVLGANTGGSDRYLDTATLLDYGAEL